MSHIVIETPAIDSLGKLFEEQKQAKKVAVLFDKNTEHLFKKLITASLKKQDFHVHTISVPASESSKSFGAAYKLYGDLIQANVDRSWSLVAVGGGVVGDLGGFLAASYMRGIPVVQVPTTLLAMTDSSIGGKVAVNHPMGKNMIGFFHDPSIILIDPAYLRTLPEREIYGGLAEVIKYAFIHDKRFLTFLEKHFDDVAALKEPFISEAIRRSVDAKVYVVKRDFKETTGLRATLNFGHTFAHAFERISSYKYLRHGEAVLLGMGCAAFLSYKVGNIDEKALCRINGMLSRFPLEKRLVKKYFLDIDPKVIEENMQTDKKKENKQLRFTLLSEIGKAYLHKDKISSEDIRLAIEVAKEVFR